VTVRVTDDGNPALSMTESFRITVTGLEPTLTARLGSSGQVEIEIEGPTGFTYQLLISSDIAIWISLFEFDLLNSPFVYTDDESNDVGVRFFRLRWVE